MFTDYPQIPQDDAEADARFQHAQRVDPFPDIPPSLLNSADITDYVRLTGMIVPFQLEKLKSASYEAAIAGRCMWWDERREWKEVRLENPGDKFILQPNSIAFVQVEPKFRLPDYMALRFNLKIKHVHRGILLGTGPLVDPGFVGHLLIPLHNLTTNDYELEYKEGLIWIEFTKTSPVSESGELAGIGSRRGLTRTGMYKPFPEEKKNATPEDYFNHAAPHRTIRSSIPEALVTSRDAAERAAQSAGTASRHAERIARRFQTLGIVSLMALVIALAGLAVMTWSLINDTRAAISSSEERFHADVVRRGGERDERLRSLEGRVESLLKEVSTLAQALERTAAELTRGRPGGTSAVPGGSPPSR